MAPSQLVSNVPPSVSLLASVTNHLYLIHADNCTLLATLMAASSPTSFRYQTDNGGQYCFCKEECDTKLEQTIKGLRFPAGKYPKVQSLSFQGGWWKNKLLDTSQPAPWCVSSWEPNTTKFRFRGGGEGVQTLTPIGPTKTHIRESWVVSANHTLHNQIVLCAYIGRLIYDSCIAFANRAVYANRPSYPQFANCICESQLLYNKP